MIVVFDTNVYLDLTRDLDCRAVECLALRLWERERLRGGLALACPAVMWELLAHLCDPSDPCRDASVKAVTLLAVHCQTLEESTGLNVAASFEGEICRVIFHKEIDGLEDLILRLGQICKLVAYLYLKTGNESLAASGCNTGSIETLSTMMAHEEERFKEMFRSDVLTVDPKGRGKRITEVANHAIRDVLKDIRSDSMLVNLALKLVFGMAGALGEQLGDQQAWNYALQVRTLFPVPLEILRELWERVVTNEFDIDHPKKQRGNFHWDINIAAVVSGVIAGESVLLVTSDQAMIRACARAGCGDNVMRTAAYRDLVCL